ncbi:hypothetical protein [Amycolatopsis decaplanina]|uniref:Uncharacterized protein n=1 Tax=Amycolatopsis decaplanina DSM 44594 TaxID=1284240 RepID=M2ZCG9_9PSEU|nr:hypothetical protein [Amycolatopsis decaplanina]EME58583.1 hypothetical protein H074_18428 [Amycolatopsis decaplanina DSM 44594]
MSSAYPSPADRRKRAEQDIAELGAHRDSRLLLRVRCSANHHVAAVYDTPHGPVLVVLTGPHAHGSRDFVDVPHGAHDRGREYVDSLVGNGGDLVPAWCECGTRRISRSVLRQTIARHKKSMILN